jgi:hypothetical protein
MSDLLKRMESSFERNVRSGIIPKSVVVGYGGFFVDKGVSYEKKIVNLLKNTENSSGKKCPLVYPNFTSAGTSLYPDVRFYANEKKNLASVEVKTSFNTNWFTKKLVVEKVQNSYKWNITNPRNRGNTHDLLKEIFHKYENSILDSISNDFDLPKDEDDVKGLFTIENLYELFENKTFTSKFGKYTNTNQKVIETSFDVVEMYEKYLHNLNTYYIQIKGNGLYYIGEDKYKINDNLPPNKKIKQFSIRTASISLKKANKGGQKHQLEINVSASSKSIPKSGISLDNKDDLTLIADFVYKNK